MLTNIILTTIVNSFVTLSFFDIIKLLTNCPSTIWQIYQKGNPVKSLKYIPILLSFPQVEEYPPLMNKAW